MKRDKPHTEKTFLSKNSLKENPFTVPENYFKTIENQIVSELNLQNIQPKKNESTYKTPQNYFDNIEEITITKLKAEVLQNTNTSKLPDGYFDTLEDLILTKIKKEQKVITIKRITKYVAPLAIAASLLLIFVLNTAKKSVTFDSLATTEIEQFVESGMIDINMENLAAVFTDFEYPVENLTTSITDDEVLEYLTIEDLETIIYEN